MMMMTITVVTIITIVIIISNLLFIEVDLSGLRKKKEEYLHNLRSVDENNGRIKMEGMA